VARKISKAELRDLVQALGSVADRTYDAEITPGAARAEDAKTVDDAIAALQRLREAIRASGVATCSECGEAFVAVRPGVRTCSSRCAIRLQRRESGVP
jgi:hypothetical protein